MQGYSGIEKSSSACIRFVRNHEVDGSEQELFEEIRRRGVRCVYVDPTFAEASGEDLANQLAVALGLENAPYESRRWLCMLDDLITLAHQESGLIIVIDNAWTLLGERRDELCDLIEAFLSQFHHWFERRKPCYLCFQMEVNPGIARFFRDQLCE